MAFSIYKLVHKASLVYQIIFNVCFRNVLNLQILGGGGGYSGFQVTGMMEWSQKSRPKKIPRVSSKTQKNPWTKNADYCITRAM